MSEVPLYRPPETLSTLNPDWHSLRYSEAKAIS